jgi:hypothetical protein
VGLRAIIVNAVTINASIVIVKVAVAGATVGKPSKFTVTVVVCVPTVFEFAVYRYITPEYLLIVNSELLRAKDTLLFILLTKYLNFPQPVRAC